MRPFLILGLAAALGCAGCATPLAVSWEYASDQPEFALLVERCLRDELAEAKTTGSAQVREEIPREQAKAMRRLLARENHVVDVAESLRMGRAALTDNAYDVVLLDRRLPDGDGAQLIKFARRNRLRTRFLIVSALGETVQRVEGLDLGADDYIVKPFEPEELFARLRAAARRPLPETTRVIEVGNLALHCQQRQVTVAGKSLMLPRRELTVLEKLMERAGAVVPRDTLEGAMYGYDDFVQSNTLESHISRLRKHLADCGANVGIQPVRGVGYLLRKTGEAA